MAKVYANKMTQTEYDAIESHVTHMLRACEAGVAAMRASDPSSQSGYVLQQIQYFKNGISHYKHCLAIAKQRTGLARDVNRP